MVKVGTSGDNRLGKGHLARVPCGELEDNERTANGAQEQWR